ncbi:MAG: TonB-dependent receptor [Halioglobus sp.]|nr:TonB-dependent receptor [Halioglobus sp.]
MDRILLPVLTGSFLTRILTTALALTCAPAWAQETVGDDTGSRYRGPLEEVLVTAQKREETSMSVPLSVNVFTAQDMINTGALNIEDIDDFMPGVEFGGVTTNQSTQLGVEIRGVRSPNISSGQDPSVATFYDNAYMPRAVTTIPFLDIARVEVLKGPQGTLYGRNATAGVINMIPNTPAPEFDAFVRTRLGNYDRRDFEGMLNLPLGDQLALRANLIDHYRGAIFDNVGIGDDLRKENYTFGRLALQWQPSADTRIRLAGDVEDRNENTNYSIGVSKYAFSMDPFNDKVENDVPDREENRDMYGVSLQIEHDFNDRWSVFGITSYRDWETFNKQDEDGTARPRRYLDTNNIEESDIWYNEVRFNFVDARFDIVFGANYSEESVFQRTDIGILTDSYMQFLSQQLLPEVGVPADADTHAWDVFAGQTEQFWLDASAQAGTIVGNDGIAVLPPEFAGIYFTETMANTGDFINWGIFGDVSYQLTDTVTLIGGLRYSYDDKEYSWQTLDNSLAAWPFAPARVAFDPSEAGVDPAEFFDRFDDDENWSKTTGRAVVEWNFMDTAMTYLSFATGYKSGGFDGQVFSAVVAGPFDPEEMTSTEWGLKGDFFGNRVRVETALFYQELDNRQGTESVKEGPDDPTAQPRVVSSDEETWGWEILAHWQVIDSLRLTGLTTVRDTERVQEPFFNADGEPDGGEPENLDTRTDYTLSLDWTPEIPTGFLLVHVDYIFNQKEDRSEAVIFTEGPWYFQDRELLNARIAWSDDGDKFEVALWGRNLLDKEYAENPGGFAADEDDALGAFKTNVQDPLTYGVDLRYNF